MFGNLLIKWKLAILMAIMVMALAIVGFSGYAGIVRISAAVDEVGKVRLPSIQGLLGISEGQTAVTAADLTAAIAENDYLTASRFDEALRLRAKGWASTAAPDGRGRGVLEAVLGRLGWLEKC